MEKVISSENIPIKMWLNEIEDGALEQAKNLANLPFAFRHIALMPDCHQGYGMPIGGVLATKGVVIPNAVGKDIGCGVMVVKTSLIELNKKDILSIVRRIKEAIPVGFKHHNSAQSNDFILPGELGTIISEQAGKIDFQIGTLGSGNHFIEIQKCESDNSFWIMIHSGSRNLGSKVADYYDKLAAELNSKWFSSVNKGIQLAFFPMNTPEFRSYMIDMKICMDFAFHNRKLMMNKIKNIFHDITNCNFDEVIDTPHNYAKMEHHYGSNVMVHRKAAVQARKDQIISIPGSQGTKSYIIEGLGNKESFESCSHGAGRKMGRSQAIKTLDFEHEKGILEEKGIIHTITTKDNLDEAPGAYKDIDEVMNNQNDLVKIIHELTPLAVIKG